MQTTFQMNTENLNSQFLKTVLNLFGRKKEIKITIEEIEPIDKQEELFRSLFGSWKGDEIGEELVQKIYSSRENTTYNFDL